MVVVKKRGNEFSGKKLGYFLFILFVLAIVLLYLIIKPFLMYIILAAILVMFFFPLNKLIQRYVSNKILSSWIMVVLVLLFFLVPGILFMISLAGESSNVIYAAKNIDLKIISEQIKDVTNYDINFNEWIDPLILKFGNFITTSLPEVISSVTEVMIGLFVMFFIIYYGFKEGEQMAESFLNALPMSKFHKKEIVEETKKVLGGVMYGQLLVAFIQGVIGGIGFWIFGVPNPVLWGFVMAIFAFIPVLGTPVVWVPAVILEFYAGDTWIAIGLLLYSLILTTNIDNVIKPKIIGKSTGMHPVLVLLGILGGIALFGILGMIIGPVVVALCVLIIKFFNADIHLG